MSTADEAASILASRNIIRAKLVELGLANSSDKLDALAAAIADLVNQGAVSVTVKEGDTYTIPAGLHNGSGTVSSIAGGGNYTLQQKTVVPTKKQQAVTAADGYYGLSGVTVGPIPDNYQDVSGVTAEEADVMAGKIFVGRDGVVKAGSIINNGTVDVTLDVASITYFIPKGRHSGEGKVSITLEARNVTPTKQEQVITPAPGKVLSKVTVEPIPDRYQDVTQSEAVEATVLEGVKFVDKTGEVKEGAMRNWGALEAYIDGLTTTRFNIPAGYHNGEGWVYLTDDIERALAEI